jgi:hypothetical protein
MKIGKKSWLAVVLGAVAIALVGLTVTYFRQVDQLHRMQEQFVQTQANLDQVQITKLLLNKESLETELKLVTVEMESARSLLNIPVSSSIVTKTLFDVARGHSLVVDQMTSSVPVLQKGQGIQLYQTILTARVEGDFSNFIDFFLDLDRHFSTGTVRSLMVTIPEDLVTDNASADFDMYIYSLRR